MVHFFKICKAGDQSTQKNSYSKAWKSDLIFSTVTSLSAPICPQTAAQGYLRRKNSFICYKNVAFDSATTHDFESVRIIILLIFSQLSSARTKCYGVAETRTSDLLHTKWELKYNFWQKWINFKMYKFIFVTISSLSDFNSL